MVPAPDLDHVAGYIGAMQYATRWVQTRNKSALQDAVCASRATTATVTPQSTSATQSIVRRIHVQAALLRGQVPVQVPVMVQLGGQKASKKYGCGSELVPNSGRRFSR